MTLAASPEPLIQIAKAVAAALNDNRRNWSQPFTAHVSFDTELALENAATLDVTIVPGRATSQLLDRDDREGDYTIDVAVRKRATLENQAEVEALFAIQREIDSYLFELDAAFGRRLPRYAAAMWTASTLRWPYVPQHLRQQRQFTGINSITYHILGEDET
jgi:hypothetical protein